MKFDIVGIGEALVEFAEFEPRHYVQSFAGDVLNTLYYATRLGLGTSFFSTISHDSYGKDLEAFLDSHKIDRSHLLHSAKENGLYIIRTNTEGEPQFTFYRSDSAARTTFEVATEDEIGDALTEGRALLFSAIGLGAFRNRGRMLDAIKSSRSSRLVYFDANVRASQWPDFADLRELLADIASMADIVSVSVSDDRKLYGVRSTAQTLDHFAEMGYRKIILRDGPHEVHLRFDEADYVVPPLRVGNVVDTTGAGDAFNAAFIYGLLHGFDPRKCAELGSCAAAQVIQHRGGIVSAFDPNLIFAAV